MDRSRLPRPEDSADFEPPLLVLTGVDFEDGLETSFGATFVFLAAEALLSAGLDSDFFIPKSNDGLFELSEDVDFGVSIPKSNDGLSNLSVGFDGC